MTPHISTPNPVGQHRSYTIWYQETPSVDGGGGRGRKCHEIKIICPLLDKMTTLKFSNEISNIKIDISSTMVTGVTITIFFSTKLSKLHVCTVQHFPMRLKKGL